MKESTSKCAALATLPKRPDHSALTIQQEIECGYLRRILLNMVESKLRTRDAEVEVYQD